MISPAKGTSFRFRIGKDGKSIKISEFSGLSTQLGYGSLNFGSGFEEAQLYRKKRGVSVLRVSYYTPIISKDSEQFNAVKDVYRWFRSTLDSTKPIEKKNLIFEYVPDSNESAGSEIWRVENAVPISYETMPTDLSLGNLTFEQVEFAYTNAIRQDYGEDERQSESQTDKYKLKVSGQGKEVELAIYPKNMTLLKRSLPSILTPYNQNKQLTKFNSEQKSLITYEFPLHKDIMGEDYKLDKVEEFFSLIHKWDEDKKEQYLVSVMMGGQDKKGYLCGCEIIVSSYDAQGKPMNANIKLMISPVDES